MKKWLLSAILVAIPASAADWPQFRGVNFDGATSEKIAVKWSNALSAPPCAISLGSP